MACPNAHFLHIMFSVLRSNSCSPWLASSLPTLIILLSLVIMLNLCVEQHRRRSSSIRGSLNCRRHRPNSSSSSIRRTDDTISTHSSSLIAGDATFNQDLIIRRRHRLRCRRDITNPLHHHPKDNWCHFVLASARPLCYWTLVAFFHPPCRILASAASRSSFVLRQGRRASKLGRLHHLLLDKFGQDDSTCSKTKRCPPFPRRLVHDLRCRSHGVRHRHPLRQNDPGHGVISAGTHQRHRHTFRYRRCLYLVQGQPDDAAKAQPNHFDLYMSVRANTFIRPAGLYTSHPAIRLFRPPTAMGDVSCWRDIWPCPWRTVKLLPESVR